MNKNDIHSNPALQVTPFVSAAALIVYVISILVTYESCPRVLISNILFAVPILTAAFIVVKSYIAHNKNVTKSLLGFILSGLVMLSMHYAFSYLDATKWYCNVKAFIFLIIAVFTVNQFLLSNSHYSRPVVLFINQQLMVWTIILSIAGAVIDAFTDDGNPLILISLLLFVISVMFIVLSIEMKVNARKLQRAETGYVFVSTETSDDVIDEEDMFISNRYFYSMPWLVLVGLTALFIFNAVFDKAITWGYSIRYLFFVVKFMCLFAAVRTYRTHNKDVMKILLGFLLGMLLFENIFEITFISTSSLTSLKSIVTMLMVIANIYFVVTHLLLTKTHSSHEKIIKLMKIAYAVYVVLALVVAVDCSIYYFMAKGANYVFFMFKPIMWLLGTFPVITGIVTIDTRVNGFKLRREQKK